MRTHLVCLAFAGLVTACGGPSDSVFGSPSTPTYYADVAPIVRDKCLSCHSDGNIAPFSLETFEDVREVAQLVKSATAERRMPPWNVDGTGSCNHYRDDPSLSDEEIETIAAWVDGGRSMGDPADAPGPSVAAAGLADVGATLDPIVEYAPDAGLADDYRCFLVDPAVVGADRFLRGYQARPGRATEVHHVVVWALDSAADEATVAALDASEAGPGYTCFGGPGVAAPRTLVAWAPGTPATRFPEGTGLRMLAGRKMVMQVHYNLAGGAAPDRTLVDLDLADSVAREAVITGIGDFDLNLPPGQASVHEGSDTPFDAPVIPVAVLGVFPHMHKLGRTLRVDATQNGSDRCLVDVPRYDFTWQRFFFYDEPVMLGTAPGSLHIDCGYDTRGVTETTHFGEGTGDEMCLSGFYVSY